MTGKPLVKRGARPLNINPGLARTLVNFLLKVAKDERFTSGKLKSNAVLRKLFKEQGVPFEKLCMRTLFPNATDVDLTMLGVPVTCKLGAPEGPLNYFRDTILPKVIEGEVDFQLNNDDEKTILKVLNLKINEGGKIIDLRKNEPLKTQKEKKKEFDEKLENKEKGKAREQQWYEGLKQTPTDVVNNKGELLNQAQVRARDQYKRLKETPTDGVNNKGEPLNQAQVRARDQYKKMKETPTDIVNKNGEPMNQAQVRNRGYYEKRKERNKQFILDQLIHRPPARMDAEKCSTCGREKSFGWAKVPDALWYVRKLFKEKGLKEYPSRRATIGYLTMKKRKYLGKEDILLRSTDILCYACWKICEGSAERKIQKLLQL